MRFFLSLLLLLISLPATAGEPSEGAEPPTLPTTLASDLLGEDFMGMPMPDAHMWSGKLVELAEAVSGLGTRVNLGKDVPGEMDVALVSTAPVTLELAIRALDALAQRAGLEFKATGESASLHLPGPGAEVEGQIELIIAVVGPGGVLAMADLYERFGMAGPGAVVLKDPALGAVIVATTREAMAQPMDLDARAAGRERAAPVLEPVLAEGVEQLGENHYRVQRSVVEPLLDGQALGRSFRMVPNYREGEPQGFKLFSIRPRSVLHALKVRNGDVMLQVGDTSLLAIENMDEPFLAWMTREEVTLAVLRRGSEVTLRYEMAGDPLEIPILWSLSEPSLDRYREHHGVEVDHGGVQVPRAVVLAQQELLPSMRWRQVLEDDQLAGFGSHAAGGNLLHLIGMQPREQLIALDGEPLDSPERLMGLYTALRTNTEVVLILRTHDDVDREIRITVLDDPDPDSAPWPLDLLDIIPTLAQRRAAAGIVEQDGRLVVPRALVGQTFTADHPHRFNAFVGDARLPSGCWIEGRRRSDALELLGIRTWDRITAVGDATVQGSGEVEDLLVQLLTGDEVSVTVERRGTGPVQLHWTLVGEPIPLPGDWSDLGITIEPSVAELREQLGIQVLGERFVVPRHVVVQRAADLRTMRPAATDTGIVLGHEVPRSPATLLSLLDLQRGDIIQSFNALPVDTTEALHDLIRAFHALRTITVEIRRGDSIVTRRYDIAGDPVEPDDLLFHTGRSLRRP